MADVFLREDAVSLLKNKHVLFVGDSNVRALYKDLVWLHKSNSLMDVGILRRRLELSYLGDKLLERSDLTRGRDFSEHRLYEMKDVKIEFLFVTRCYSKKLVTILQDIKSGKRRPPDVMYMNSCLWDVCRWGPNGVKDYKSNMVKLMKLLTSTLPAKTLFIWGTALPTASSTSGGLIIKQIEFIQAALRIHVIEANKFTSSLVSSYGYDVLDFHHYMHYQIVRRSADGIHFLPPAVRFLINLFLTHIALSWDVKLPERLKDCTSPLENQIKCALNVLPENVDCMVQKMDEIANNLSCAAQPVTPQNKKKRNERKRHSPIVINLPPYEKAPKPVFKRKVTKENNEPCNDPSRDFRLLSFNNFSPNVNIQQFYQNYDTPNYHFAQNQRRESSHPTKTFNRYKRDLGSYIPSNVANYYNDPYNSTQQNNYNYQGNHANYQENDANYQGNRANCAGNYGIPLGSYYNPLDISQINTIALLNHCITNIDKFKRDYHYYSHLFESHGFTNAYNNGYTNRPGPIRSRSKTGNRNWTPYNRDPYN